METIKIVNETGIGLATKVTTRDGKEIEGITKLDIDINGPDCLVTARLAIDLAFCDVEAHPMLSMETLVELADYYGLKLVKK